MLLIQEMQSFNPFRPYSPKLNNECIRIWSWCHWREMTVQYCWLYVLYVLYQVFLSFWKAKMAPEKIVWKSSLSWESAQDKGKISWFLPLLLLCTWYLSKLIIIGWYTSTLAIHGWWSADWVWIVSVRHSQQSGLVHRIVGTVNEWAGLVEGWKCKRTMLNQT